MPTTPMASPGSTSNKNEITEEDNVTVFVAYDGKWEYDGKEWFFKNSRSSIIVVQKNVTLSQITDFLYKELEVDQKLYRLRLEVHYRTGSPWFPVTEIQNDPYLSVFISETSKTKLPLCVTPLRYKDKISSDADEISSDVAGERRKVESILIKAIREDDWVKAREIVNSREVKWTSKLNDEGNTAFHFAVGRYKDNEVVRDVLKKNSELILTTVKKDGETPAHTAALYGNTEALMIMLDSNPKCLFIPDNGGYLPIHYVPLIPTNKKTFLYLFKQMKSYKEEFADIFSRGKNGFELLRLVIDSESVDIAYELIRNYPSMATQEFKDGQTPLECIVRKLELFYSGTHYNLCQRFVYHHVPIENKSSGSTDTTDLENQKSLKKDKFVTNYMRRCLHDAISRIFVKLWEIILHYVPHVKHLKDEKVKHKTTIELLRCICQEIDRAYTSSDIIERLYSSPFCLAAENNTVEAIHVLTTYFAGLYDSKQDGQNIYQLTVLNHSEKVYSYILHRGHDTETDLAMSKDDDDNNILHFAGHLAPIHKLNAVSGAALQMQQELQWFEEVKKVVPPTLPRDLNKKKETPIMVFRREHEKLRKDGEEWMKKTADSYTITAALIITIVFAAAITVPGGNDSTTGKPIYQTKSSLIIFAISDAISLFTSTTSLLFFLSILTARYADEDFLYKLPQRLIFGLVMLFVSVTSMMIAFGATLYIMFGQEKHWILIPIGALACLPIASFMKLQFPLLFELISSTYGPGIFDKKKDYWQSSANANKKKRA